MFIETNFQSGNISQVNQLVQSGGKFENAQVFIQGDRDGPHKDDMLQSFFHYYCHQEGCKWYPQAPQIPHANFLDLSVFPAVSQRNCNFIRTKHVL